LISVALTATFFFDAIDFVRVQVLGRSYTWWNWLVFQKHCEHLLASSRVSHQAVDCRTAGGRRGARHRRDRQRKLKIGGISPRRGEVGELVFYRV
jgi:hypothetical protein